MAVVAGLMIDLGLCFLWTDWIYLIFFVTLPTKLIKRCYDLKKNYFQIPVNR